MVRAFNETSVSTTLHDSQDRSSFCFKLLAIPDSSKENFLLHVLWEYRCKFALMIASLQQSIESFCLLKQLILINLHKGHHLQSDDRRKDYVLLLFSCEKCLGAFSFSADIANCIERKIVIVGKITFWQQIIQCYLISRQFWSSSGGIGCSNPFLEGRTMLEDGIYKVLRLTGSKIEFG